MTDEKWLRDGLADAVPEAPQVPGRAAAARDEAARRRRRTTSAVLGGAVAVVAIAGIGFVAFDRDEPAAPPSDEPTVAVDPPGPYDALACPPAPRPGDIAPPDVPDPDAPANIPDGATSVRLCQGVGTPIDVPDDALVTDPQSLADLVNALPTVENPDEQICTMELGPGYRLVFGYDDGSQFATSGQRYGCRNIVVGSSTRATADRPWEAFHQGLRAQRKELAPTGEVAQPTCEVPSPSTLTDPTELVAVTLCVKQDGRVLSAPIAPADVPTLVGDIERNGDHHGVLRCALAAPYPYLVGVNQWGDAIFIRSDCGTSWWALDDTTGKVWMPGREATRILDDAVASVS